MKQLNTYREVEEYNRNRSIDDRKKIGDSYPDDRSEFAGSAGFALHKANKEFTDCVIQNYCDAVAVGDLDSDAAGSGARKNAGKARVDLVPVRFWRSRLQDMLHEDARLALNALQFFQEGDDLALNNYLGNTATMFHIDSAVKVFEFGSKKYKAWNWAKGMDWSVPTACIIRHLQKIANGEPVDEESGELHMGHVLCNMYMLAWYVEQYPEGDDRPPMRERKV